MGLALQYARWRVTEQDLRVHQRVLAQRTELRVYDAEGSGYHFARAAQAQRWYYRESTGAEHFCRADQADLDEAIAAGATVQLCGPQGQSLGLWPSWGDFADALAAAR